MEGVVAEADVWLGAESLAGPARDPSDRAEWERQREPMVRC